MTIYAYIECINLLATANDLSVDESSGGSTALTNTWYRWALVDDQISVDKYSEGVEEDLLEWLANNQHPVALVFSGEYVVSQQVFFQDSERKYFEKMLPYELEENILDDIDDLHFVTAKKKQSPVTVAYTQKKLLDQLFAPFNSCGISVDYCFVDYQLLSPKENEMIFWFSDDRLLCCSPTGIGFSTQGAMARNVLESVLTLEVGEENNKIEKFLVYVSSNNQGLSAISPNNFSSYDIESVKNIFHTLVPEKTIIFYEGDPALTLNQPLTINFCCGAYKNKASLSKQVKQFSLLGLLAVVAVLFFLGVNLIEATLLKQKNTVLLEKIQTEVRKVIPEGNIQKNPVRQLTNKLDKVDVTTNEPSQVIILLSNLAPVIQSLNIDLSTINYSHKEKAIRLNIQAGSFGQLESVRTELKNKGLLAELLESNAVDDKFQARLRIQLEEK